MVGLDPSDQYYVYENRLASFQAKRRASNASSRSAKALSWPHKSLPPFELAKAGFYYVPSADNPDNVVCFLCKKNLDGWEAGDNPVEEHLKHSPNCGWAVTAAVEAEYGGLERVDPRDAKMLDARKATFAGRWPYENKKSWKCKTKQLAEAGWKYTPTNESDDNTTCAYCQLALDGWEAGDKPMDEHYKRSPACPFFELISQNPAPPKKPARSRIPRGSKVSRMSVQSAATATSDMTSVIDSIAGHDDSVMTTASTMTQSSRKTIKGKKTLPAPAKNRKTRGKKEEPVEIHEDANSQDVDTPPPLPPKPTRGRKRGSDAVEDSVITNTEAPALKKRATRARGSQTADTSALTAASQADADMTDARPVPPAKTGRKRAATGTKGRTRKASAASVASTASTASLRACIPDDDELDRQLQADLERPLTDDEDLAADSESERKRVPETTKGKAKKSTKKTVDQSRKKDEPKGDYAMFNPIPPRPNEAAVEADLKTLEAEIEAEKQVQQLQVPKKGRKPGTRKASKQVDKSNEVPHPEPENQESSQHQTAHAPETEEVTPSAQLAEEAEIVHDASEMQNSSTITITKAHASQPKRGRGRPKKSSTSSVTVPDSSTLAPIPSRAQPESPTQQSMQNAAEDFEIMEVDENTAPATTGGPRAEVRDASPPTKASSAKPPVTFSSPEASKQRPLPLPPSSVARQQPPIPPTAPRAGVASHVSPAPSARQAALSPSQSPQSSDAENQPPSSRPTTARAAAANKRVVLASAENQRIIATPTRSAAAGSPSKRANHTNHTIGGLMSTIPWSPVDLDVVFCILDDSRRETSDPAPGTEESGSTDKGNPAEKFFRIGGHLSSPERRMTVEEFIHHCANQAEQKLKHECETMVSAFEREGTRAMRVLEGLVVESS